jgi:transcriptional regulator with XRE-family HTH domain
MPKSAALDRAPRSTDRHVGSRIRLRRIMLQLSQGRLGDAVGVTFQQIQKYEKGANRVGASRLQDIADALGCQPTWFFEGMPGQAGNGGTALRRVDAALSAFAADKYAPRLIRGFVRLTPQVKRAIINLITAAADWREES